MRLLSRTVLRELAWMDEITGTSFACFDRFPIMATVTMLYFTAAVYCEERERLGEAGDDDAFLLADHAKYRATAAHLFQKARTIPTSEAERFMIEGFTIMRAVDVTDQEVLSSIKRDLIDRESIVSHTKFGTLQAKLRTLFPTERPDGVEGGTVSAGLPAHGAPFIRQFAGGETAPEALASKPTGSALAPGASGEAQLGEVTV